MPGEGGLGALAMTRPLVNGGQPKLDRIRPKAHLEVDLLSSFASEKLDWIDTLIADPTLDARAKLVGICIMQHVNQNSREAFLSDETLSDKTSISIRSVHRARTALRNASWLAWRRTRTANVYVPLTTRMNAIIDRQILLRDERNERRKRRRELLNKQSRSALDGRTERFRAAMGSRTGSATCDRT